MSAKLFELIQQSGASSALIGEPEEAAWLRVLFSCNQVDNDGLTAEEKKTLQDANKIIEARVRSAHRPWGRNLWRKVMGEI